MKQQCAMLLPDQTYEQCQAMLTPMLVIRKILQESRDAALASIDGKQHELRANGGRSKKVMATGKLRRIEVHDEDRGATPDNFVRTSEFFNNIPDYTGDPLGPFGMAADADGGGADHKFGPHDNAADVLRECEEFLHTHRIRPDFFCRYRMAIE